MRESIEIPFYDFPERRETIAQLLAMARGEIEASFTRMVVETSGGKTRLAKYIVDEAVGVSMSALYVMMPIYGPDTIIGKMSEALGIATYHDEVWGPDLTIQVQDTLPIEIATKKLLERLKTSGIRLILVDCAHVIHMQRSEPAKRWIQAFFKMLIKQYGINVVFMEVPANRIWPKPKPMPGVINREMRLNTIGDSPVMRDWLGNLQDKFGKEKRTLGRLTDKGVLKILIARNYGMLGFIERDAFDLLNFNHYDNDKVPVSLLERIRLPMQGGGDRFAYEVYEELIRHYET